MIPPKIKGQMPTETTIMETSATIKRKAATVRLPETMIADLHAEAKRQGISFSGFIEIIAEEAIYHRPNEETLAAIEESKAGKYAGTIDTSSMEAFRKSMGI